MFLVILIVVHFTMLGLLIWRDPAHLGPKYHH